MLFKVSFTLQTSGSNIKLVRVLHYKPLEAILSYTCFPIDWIIDPIYTLQFPRYSPNTILQGQGHYSKVKG